MKFSVEFNTDNSAFEENAEYEVEKMLHFVARQVYLAGKKSGTIIDSNGNSIGRWSWE